MNPLQILRSASPAKLFAIGFLSILGVTFVSNITRFSGVVALDKFRADESTFNIAHLELLVPLVIALNAGIYALFARISRNKLNPILVSIHFWTSLAFACFLIYLARDSVDLPATDWHEIVRPQLEPEVPVFIYARILYGAVQIIFLLNLLWSYFWGREIQAQKA
jgi:heme/copper-type cytochrome/quinol oxidase subunit 1